MRNLARLQKDDHILGLTNVVFEKDRLCSSCQAGKQVGAHHLAKNILSSSTPLKLLHMDLFGPIAYISIGGNKYGLVIVMTFPISLGYSSCKIKVKPREWSRSSLEEFKMNLSSRSRT
jgi:hypothetical protein